MNNLQKLNCISYSNYNFGTRINYEFQQIAPILLFCPAFIINKSVHLKCR
jgi:hypothetical protein